MKTRLFVTFILVVSSLSFVTSGATAQKEARMKGFKNDYRKIAGAQTYREAPMLAARVAVRQLPPVEQRLPANPVVITPTESVGQYGGTWHAVSWYSAMGNVLFEMYDPPIRWKADYTGYEPGLAESYQWSTNGTTFTLHLRQGLKWSDGQPYTSEDWRFWWEDMAKNTNYTVVSVPFWLRKSDGSPVDMEFPDAYTVVWKSDKPQWVTSYFMAQGFWEFANPMMKPAHYLKQFHPTYNSSATYQGLEAVDKWWENPDFPCLFAWCTYARKQDEDGSRITYARNPYYWKVDTQGNQLPYIDYLEVEIVPDMQQRLQRAAQGRYDAVFHGIGGPTDIPFLTANASAGGYHLQPGWMSGAGAWPGYMVNQDYVAGGNNYPDDTREHADEIRAVLRDKRFRKALSVGFDRQSVIQAVWDGNATAQGFTISPQSQHFVGAQGQQVFQNWATADTQYNVTQANQWLDQVGMIDVNGDKWRDLPSGKPFTLTLDFTDWGGSYAVQQEAAIEMRAQWERNLGIKVQLNDLQNNSDLASTRNIEGYYMLRAVLVSELDLWTSPDWVFPVRNRYMFPLEGRWYETNGQAGIQPEPGSPAALLQALYNQGLATADINARHQIVWQAIQIHIDEGPFVIGVSGDQPMPVVIKNDFHNVPGYGVLAPWAPASPGNMHPEQFWIDAYNIYVPLVQK